MTERVCGECSACCKTHAIREINKKEGRWCEHCRPGKGGCGIYEIRPPSCRNFVCEWLRGFGEEEDRPDRVKYVLDFAVHEGGPETGTLQIFEAMEGGLERPSVRKITTEVLAHGIFVSHLYLSGRRKLFVPDGFHLSEETIETIKRERLEISKL